MPDLEVAIPASGLIVALWAFVCNERTYMQQMKVLDVVRGHIGRPTFNARMEAVRAVPYWRHLWFVATFRDPLRLYPDILAQEVRDVA